MEAFVSGHYLNTVPLSYLHTYIYQPQKPHSIHSGFRCRFILNSTTKKLFRAKMTEYCQELVMSACNMCTNNRIYVLI